MIESAYAEVGGCEYGPDVTGIPGREEFGDAFLQWFGRHRSSG